LGAVLEGRAEGRVNPAPILTGKVGLSGVAGAFEALASPEGHVKILVEPGRD
jgi:threonine dehydrogenase-like Zn-dependent dehydrogenase